MKEEKDSPCSKPAPAARGTGSSSHDPSDQSQPQLSSPSSSSTSNHIAIDQINNQQQISQSRMSEPQQNQTEANHDSSNHPRTDAGGNDSESSEICREGNQCRYRHSNLEGTSHLTNGRSFTPCQGITNEIEGGSNDQNNDDSKAIWTDDHQKLTDYAASIEKVKDVRRTWSFKFLPLQFQKFYLTNLT